MEDLTGQRLGSCVIIRHLRSGGMGDIYLANQPDLGRQVAVKVIRPDLGATFVDNSTATFLQEARAVAALEHPHILPIYDFGEVGGRPYLVMQYVPTGSLADLLAARTTPGFTLPMVPVLAATIISQAAAALQYAHDREVMHLDVKPHNMLMRLLGAPSDPKGAPQPHLLLADFGLARSVSLTSPGTPASGTPLYAAPEQFAEAAVPASDQYALAGVAFQLLTGSPLFSGSIAELLHQHQAVPPPPATALNPQLPDAVNAVFVRALAKNPNQRYSRVEDFAQQLGIALRTAATAPSAAAMAVPPPTPPRLPTHMPDQTVAPQPWSAPASATLADNAATVGMYPAMSAGNT
ncbi:MAG: serine/threonine protein kinase, partial [Ktedonobacterales bacterium]|nr:serine/threonine protein kinase [Ktedonobacterales bacterium]